ncbi:hypothetical protein B0J12DRAFT_705923 [Macrophomina phaseolina]|uniref:Uncharacterized protein n=1 Tax=Macrophomina phaseolina TaxID=35725 RepID=A0ABQ8FQQ5_9PEZI|nr:hypothetical protein B0J12DRAFT_705923 [Macrophomina phaseolina]
MAPNAASLSQEDRQTGTRAPLENQRVTRQQSAMRPQAENTSQDTIHVQPAQEATPPRTRRVAFNETHRSKIWDHEAQIGYLQRKDQFSSENFLKIEEKFTQLAEQNRQLEERVAQLAEQNQKLEEKVEQLTTENKKFDREIERLFENEEHQENHNKSLEKRIEESTIQAHQLTERLDTMSLTPQVNN